MRLNRAAVPVECGLSPVDGDRRMSGERTGVCPDCCYPISGLPEPRCPECGVEFSPRLLAEPHLAVPRPAWERRRHVLLPRAVLSTCFDLTCRPRRFLSGLAQPDRLGRALLWAAGNVVAAFLLVFAVHTLDWLPWGRLRNALDPQILAPELAEYRHLLLPTSLAIGFAALPSGVLCVVADLLMWRRREDFRRFAKCVCYTSTVHLLVWLLFLGVHLVIILKDLRSDEFMLPLHESVPAVGWFLAASLTWQTVLLLLYARHPSFLRSMKSRGQQAALVVSIGLCWGFGVYVYLYDVYFSARWELDYWSWGAWI